MTCRDTFQTLLRPPAEVTVCSNVKRSATSANVTPNTTEKLQTNNKYAGINIIDTAADRTRRRHRVLVLGS